MAALALLAALLVAAAPAAAQAPAPLNLVIPFENASGEPRAYWLAEGSAVLLTDALAAAGAPAIRRQDRVRAFERLRVPPVATLSHATVIRLGQVVGAGQVVVGSFTLDEEDLTVRARTIRLDTGRLSPEIVERGPVADMLDIYERIARRVAPSGIPGAPLASTYPTLPAFEQYIKGLLAAAPAVQIAFLTQAIKLHPTFQRARVALWDVYTAEGEHREALDVVREVPADHRLYRQARFLAGVSLLSIGDHQAAFDTFFALNDEMSDPALLNNLGVVQLRRAPRPAAPADPAQPGGRAVSYFGEAVAQDGSDPDLFFNLGYAYWLDRDTTGAIHWLREAVRRDPADAEAHYVLGVALQAGGSAAEAAREKELARQLSASHADWDARQRGANIAPPGLERIKVDIDVPEVLRVDAALIAAEKRDERDVAAFHLERGRRFFEEERDEDAIAELRRTTFLAPYDSEAHLLLGRIYLRSGRTEEAITALTIAVWSDETNEEARALLESLR